MGRWKGWLAAAAGLLACLGGARAEISDGVVRVGVLNDISGVFQDTNGPGSVMAARMAAEDFAGGGRGIRVEIVQGDHQNRADVGSALVRRWLDVDRVDAVVDVPNSAVGLAINTLLRDSRAALLASSTATSELTGAQCSPNTVQWVTDTWAIANSTAAGVMQRGGDSWYFLTVDYALGHGIVRDASSFIEARGGRVLGGARHPLGTSDLSSLLLQARSSRAKIVGLANAGADTINAVKQAAEFGVGPRSGQSLVAMLAFINDVHAMGLRAAQGVLLTEAFYWDMNEETRAWSRRFGERMGGNRVPSTNQAGVYSATLAYLRAVAAAGTDDARRAVPEMKRAPFRDPLFGDMAVRADGRAVHAMHLFEVKKPEESRYPFDYYNVVHTIPGEQAFRPVAEGGCPLVR
ncbi:MAG: ABC transporter, substrate-binding protein (cluster 4, leucine/isoleucine/valine/benzoate) [uncultured Acetobacteraceae bacterium]|uniref:ABC transporter, substrate-binding protein (Cluster 4, leucine/isoleucine/valine/benzoate) n=1 Tax=uncultured Acetobacteraceae bacterium TaxID=169975 RepID=A0A6J4JHP2_9PROT|nr:MAG: ABC transporter, substrate-binding protein (cluster 4, leucine/isoleucine/valine/benzoate) [uncultured Acetobacteraceae bacterium]